MDPRSSWQTANVVESEIDELRIGLVKDYAAIYWPRIKVNATKFIDPSGSIAGLMARIDANRGVWKAPAGTEADLRGILGLEARISDQENGLLNPRGVNALRVFPSGIVTWGGRTMDGDDDFSSEWKYIPVRRLALYIEESLYRGTQWAVFEPNDEELWASLRLNVGSFMMNLFRQGAFQGSTPPQAFYVKCDSETTPQDDINLGIVNILVGFAPLKPAEFVVIMISQKAGQSS
jgi:phage tail sheath protein FI